MGLGMYCKSFWFCYIYSSFFYKSSPVGHGRLDADLPPPNAPNRTCSGLSPGRYMGPLVAFNTATLNSIDFSIVIHSTRHCSFMNHVFSASNAITPGN